MSDSWDGWRPEMARSYVAHRVSAPPEIDGRLEKPLWRDIAWTEEFVDIEGDARPRPRFRTRVIMCWDEEHLYVAAEMEEPHVWATLRQRDSVIFHDNDFEVFIDPDGDNCDYYELEINALNTVWDLRLPRPYRDGGTAINEWDIAGLKTAVHIDGTLNDASDVDHGWSVEIAIPWNALAEFSRAPCPPRDGDQWRINFSRVQWQTRPHPAGAESDPLRLAALRSARHLSRDAGEALNPTSAAPVPTYQKIPGTREDNWVWSPQGVIDMHRPERWGYVQFSASPPETPVAFRPDPLAEAKWYLQRVHEAQKLHRAQAGAWATALATLQVSAPPHVTVEKLEVREPEYALVVRSRGARLSKESTGRLLVEPA